MANSKYNENLSELLLHSMAQPDPMLSMLEWLCARLMETEVNVKIGADKNVRSEARKGYRSGYRVRRMDTRMGTIYLMVPKLRSGGYIPFFVTSRKRSEAALIRVVQEAFVQGVSTRRMDKLAKSMGIEGMSRSQVSEIAKGLDEQVEEFRSRPLSGNSYPVLWVDAMYEKVRFDGRVISMAIILVCGVDNEGRRQVLAIEPMLEESAETYRCIFEKLKSRGLQSPSLIVSDAHPGLIAAVRKNFVGAGWQRCKVHFMRNILARVPHKSKEAFAQELKQIWLAPTVEEARKRAEVIVLEYENRYPEAISTLEAGLEDSLQFYTFPKLDAKKIASTNMLERLNREIRRRSKVVGIFPSAESYLRLIATYLIEYAEDWSAAVYMSASSIRNTLKQAA